MPSPPTPRTPASTFPHFSSDFVVNAGASRLEAASVFPPLPDSRFHNFGAFATISSLNALSTSSNDRDSLADYLAVGMVIHVQNAWRYLAAGMLAIARNSTGVATHLAYYAELRAALSILASSGICVMNGSNYTIDASGTVHWFSGNTHPATSKALGRWATIASGHNHELLDMLLYEGHTVNEWLSAMGLKASATGITTHLLNAWGLDIETNLSDDRDSRNKHSYNLDLRTSAWNGLELNSLHQIHNLSKSINSNRRRSEECLETAIVAHILKTAMGSSSTATDLKTALVRTMEHVWGYSNSTAASYAKVLSDSLMSCAGFVVAGALDLTKFEAWPIICRAQILTYLASKIVNSRTSEMRKIAKGGKLTWVSQLNANFGISAQVYLPSPTHSAVPLTQIEQSIEDALDHIESETIRISSHLHIAQQAQELQNAIQGKSFTHALHGMCAVEQHAFLTLNT